MEAQSDNKDKDLSTTKEFIWEKTTWVFDTFHIK